MYVKTIISSQRLNKALDAVADLAETAPHFDGKYWGPFATEYVVGVTWHSLSPEEKESAKIDVLECGFFGWETSAGNRVTFTEKDVTQWIVEFDTTRHSLHSNSGVGDVFDALGGVEWGKSADVIASESVSVAPWWEKDTTPAHPHLLSEDAALAEAALQKIADKDINNLTQVLHWALSAGLNLAIDAMAIAQEKDIRLDKDILMEAAKKYNVHSEMEAYLRDEDVMAV